MEEQLEAILTRYEQERDQHRLLPLLHEAQHLHGWLPETVQETVAKALKLPPANVHGVVEFYSMFYGEPKAKRVIRVCEDIACQLRGARELMAAIEVDLGLKPGETAADMSVTYERVPCLGMCEHGPCALNGRKPAGNLATDTVGAFLDGTYQEPTAAVHGGPLLTLARVGRVDPSSLDDYVANGGYRALRKALATTPEEVIDAVEDSGILGRGGAMFPVGRKWRFTRGAAGDIKHVVVNADESEPGTFKDRVLLEEDPFAVIESATLAGYAIGAEKGWIFVRGEYPRAYARLDQAIRQARADGYLGRDILGCSGFQFDIELRRGAGAYICGEETALFEAIEGRRGFPRAKPPFPTTHGLFQQPTAINNVETLVAVMIALDLGADQWRSYGTDESPGTKLFCLSGDVVKPGLYEVPFGMTIRTMIEMADGVLDGRSIQAVLIGGAAGKFVGPGQLDIRLTYEDAQAHNVPLGSGAIMVFDETADLRQALHQLSHFFVHESCGKCFPCRLGTKQQMEILGRIANGNGRDGGPQPSDRQILLDIGMAMTRTSFCGLGQTAASAVMSAIELWPELVL